MQSKEPLFYLYFKICILSDLFTTQIDFGPFTHQCIRGGAIGLIGQFCPSLISISMPSTPLISAIQKDTAPCNTFPYQCTVMGKELTNLSRTTGSTIILSHFIFPLFCCSSPHHGDDDFYSGDWIMTWQGYVENGKKHRKLTTIAESDLIIGLIWSSIGFLWAAGGGNKLGPCCGFIILATDS